MTIVNCEVLMAVGAQSYRPDPSKQAAAREQIAKHREVDLTELSRFIDSELIEYIDNYQIGILDLRGCELPDDVDPEIASSLRDNTSVYDDVTEDLLMEDGVYSRLLKLPAGEERSTAIRTRRSVLVLSLLALQNTTQSQPAKDSPQVA